MLTFLFWNMGGQLPEKTPASLARERRKQLGSILHNLVRAHDVDLLMLAEWPIPPEVILTTINERNPRVFHTPDPNSFPSTSIPWRSMRK